jgi:P-type Mg2+ transporter
MADNGKPAAGAAGQFWSGPVEAVLARLGATASGLSAAEAQTRLARFGTNQLKPRKRRSDLGLILGQFKSPLVLVLVGAAFVSAFLGDRVNAGIIVGIVAASGLLGYWQERGAAGAVDKLLAVVQVKALVRRGGNEAEIPVEGIVPGDIVVLNAGDVVPGDCRLLEERDLFCDEAALTGESFPAEKNTAELPVGTALAQRTNALFMGTHVVSGIGTAVVVRTGRATEFGRVSERLRLRPAETEFERGVRRFGFLLLEVTLVLVIAIFAANVLLKRSVLESFMFAVALAVGLTPQLLPAIISVNLSRGAQRMARSQVIVKRLASIENFGSMDVLCSDKTGTLTQGTVTVQSAIDAEGVESEAVLRAAYLNSTYQTGFTNPLDAAVCAFRKFDTAATAKLDEVPYDFGRKRMSVLVAEGGRNRLIAKGALAGVLSACSAARMSDGRDRPLAEVLVAIEARSAELSGQGLRIIGVAEKDVSPAGRIIRADEAGMTFLGMLVLADPLKTGIRDAVSTLLGQGVRLKIISGDNRLVALNIGRQTGLVNPDVLAGPDLVAVSDDALPILVDDVDIFAEVEPSQKERIVRALQKAGHVVGFLGDGINDAPALRAADVGISVDGAVDVAKEAADIVLLRKDLAVLSEGVAEGRVTFSNTLKYVFMATSANFGNMFSMAGASLFLPFLPLLPTQVLLTNLLTDLPEMTIAGDRVDAELTERPQRWDVKAIRRFMFAFGLLSSVFDFLTFGALLLVLRAGMVEFRTGWFVESVVSAAMIVLVIRTRRWFWQSRPSRALLVATLAVVAATLALPFTPLGRIFGFATLPPAFLAMMAGIVVAYLAAAEVRKRLFYRNIRRLS